MKIISTIAFALLLFASIVQSQDTFSIVAVDPETGEVGSAGASCVDLTLFPGLQDHFLGELFPGLGAINTQAWYNQTNQINARNRMNAGDSPSEIVEWLVSNDVSGQPELRQYGIVTITNEMSESAAHTGSSTDDYKNHITGTNYSIQGNILLGPEVLDSMESNFLKAEGDLACKLMAALQGANIVGADSRCTPNGTSSLFAFVKVAQPGDTFGNPSFVQSVRTAEGDGIEPIDSLQILFNMAQSCETSNVKDIDVDQIFLTYPNPAEDRIFIEIKNDRQYDLKVIDITGNANFASRVQEKLVLDVSNFSKGIYFIQLSNNKEIITKKIAIN